MHALGGLQHAWACQELFNLNTRQVFSAAMQFPHVLQDGLANATDMQKQSSGLLIASKWPIVHCGFHEFVHATGMLHHRFEPSCTNIHTFAGTDAAAAKGVAGALLDVEGWLVYVFNTHLQAGSSEETRFRQVAGQFHPLQYLINVFCRWMR